jgi:hypothetical protein
MTIKAAYAIALVLAAPAGYYFWTHVWSLGFWATTFSSEYLLLCLPMLAGNVLLAKAMFK